MDAVDFNEKWRNIITIWKEIYGAEGPKPSDETSMVDSQETWQEAFEKTLGESLRYCIKEFDRMKQVSQNHRGSILNRIDSIKASYSLSLSLLFVIFIVGC